MKRQKGILSRLLGQTAEFDPFDVVRTFSIIGQPEENEFLGSEGAG